MGECGARCQSGVGGVSTPLRNLLLSICFYMYFLNFCYLGGWVSEGQGVNQNTGGWVGE